MGISTKAIIRKGTSLKEIKEALEQKYGEVNIHTTSSNYFFLLLFNKRSMNVFFSDLAINDYGIDGVLLSLECNDESIEIMNLLLNKYGGYLDENDCDEIGFKPVNLEAFKESKEFTKEDEFRNEIIQKLGYDNLETTILLFEKYKTTWKKK